ncbi:MAG: succinate--CoA ligase subunit beta [Candidatus Aenigmarchaeota archaeon]|nr:succinate--CoA ligase subunit beta [Candidatus Aenigmarchaeota archaeon]
MKLFEFEGKEIFSKYGIRIPKGEVIAKGSKARAMECVLKAQVLVGGRGKAGGIILVKENEFEKRLAELFSKEIKGEKVNIVLAESKITIQKEVYASISVNRETGHPVFLVSAQGGVDIEELSRTSPDKIIRKDVVKPGRETFVSIEKEAGVSGLADILDKIYRIFVDMDCELVEINPLAVTPDGLVAADSKIIIDDNALYRHEGWKGKKERELSDFEREATEAGLSYVELDGDIGIIGNGAGLVMSTLDLVNLYGGKPSNFMDLGGGSGQEAMEKALKILKENTKVKKILINIFGGITRCDDMARGIVAVKKTLGIEKPMVIRLTGTNEAEALQILGQEGIHATKDVTQAIKNVVSLVV